MKNSKIDERKIHFKAEVYEWGITLKEKQKNKTHNSMDTNLV